MQYRFDAIIDIFGRSKEFYFVGSIQFDNYSKKTFYNIYLVSINLIDSPALILVIGYDVVIMGAFEV